MTARITQPVRVLCIGSPGEPDNLGFLAADALMGLFALDKVEIMALDRPGPRLIEHLRGADTVILVDAVKSGAAPGKLHRLEGRALEGSPPTTRQAMASAWRKPWPWPSAWANCRRG